MTRKILACILLSIFSVGTTTPLHAVAKQTSVQTKVERRGKKTIMTRILRIRVGKNYNGKKLAGKNAWIYEFNKKDYITALKSDKLILLYFYDDSILACKDGFANLSKFFEQYEKNNIVGFKVNFVENGEGEIKLAKAFNVESAPTIVLIKTGEKLYQTSTAWAKSNLKDKLAEFAN
jgi:thiol-disulfide isomerase/thioredoxin